MGGRESRYRADLEQREQLGLRRRLQPVRHEDARTLVCGGRRYLNVSSNDYLGLASHPALIARAREWAQRYGTGAMASRLVVGNLSLFQRIEAKVAALKGRPAALVMASGFQANAAVLAALLDKTVLGAEPLVFSDRLNHASLHFGCQAAGTKEIRYRHCDADHLQELLEKHAAEDRPKFIVTDSVFSMDGTVAPLARIAKLATDHEAFFIADDAHATGVLGAKGEGLGGTADLVIGTFSKAMGSYGAYVACSQTMRDYLINRCSGLIYSTGLPPPVLGAIDAALDLMPAFDAERAHVAKLATNFRQEARTLGFETESTTQIVPIVVGEADRALALTTRLAEAGIWATAIRPPTVPKGTARLRIAFSAIHNESDVDRLLTALSAQPAEQPAAD
jgi:8-amino-7-oxononanoate synthase